MRLKISVILLLVLCILGSSCGSDDSNGSVKEPVAVAVDSVNNRIFILENEGVLTIAAASTLELVGEEPFVNQDRVLAVHDLLPAAPSALTAISLGTTTRLFVAGGQDDGAGGQAFNLILVLDFDGTTIAAADISPLTVSDGDATSNDADNVVGGLAVDQDASKLYVTDSTAGTLHVYNGSTGAEEGTVAIAGVPNRMSLADGRLYVANSSATAALQVITVVKTSDLTTTTIDLDAPTYDVAVEAATTGTALLATDLLGGKVFIRAVTTATYADSTAIPVSSNTTNAATGALTSSLGLSGSVGPLLMAKALDGTLKGYVPQASGQITIVNFADGLTEFETSVATTLSRVFSGAALLKDGTSGITTFFTAGATGELISLDVGSTEALTSF